MIFCSRISINKLTKIYPTCGKRERKTLIESYWSGSRGPISRISNNLSKTCHSGHIPLYTNKNKYSKQIQQIPLQGGRAQERTVSSSASSKSINRANTSTNSLPGRGRRQERNFSIGNKTIKDLAKFKVCTRCVLVKDGVAHW